MRRERVDSSSVLTVSSVSLIKEDERWRFEIF